MEPKYQLTPEEAILDVLLGRIGMLDALIKHQDKPVVEMGILPGLQMAVEALQSLPPGHPLRIKYYTAEISGYLAQIIRYAHEIASQFTLDQLKSKIS